MSITCSYCAQPVVGAAMRWSDGDVACAACRAAHPSCGRCKKPATNGGPLCAACEATAKRCGSCATLISGRFVKHPEAGDLCAACAAALPTCTRCRRSFVRGESFRDQPYCADCLATAPRCALCADVVGQRFYKHPKVGVFCEPCKRESEACGRCGAPTREGRRVDRHLLCPPCFSELDTCSGCGTPITGRYTTTARAPDRKFCEACAKRAEQCDFCGVFITGEPHTYADGRASCGGCRATAVLEPAALTGLEATARAWLAERLRFALRSGVPVHLVGADAIAAVQKKAFHATPGFDLRERGLFAARVQRVLQGVDEVERTEELAIYVESGLPEREALGTVAHELVHLWQFDHFPKRPVHRQYVEGLACWAQYHLLREHGATAEAELVAANPDPIYGGGFRLLREVEAEHGFERTAWALVRRVGGRWEP